MQCSSDAPIETNWPLVSAQPPPRIHVLSDLHLQQGPYRLPEGLVFDVLVAAGNLGPVETAIAWLTQVGKPVVYLLGRQELLGAADALERARRLAVGSQVHVLERECIELAGVRFLGVCAAPLASELPAATSDPEGLLTVDRAECDPATEPDVWPIGNNVRYLVSDRQEIWAPNLAIEAWLRAMQLRPWRRWLRAQLATPFAGPTIVVSDCRPDDIPWRDGDGQSGADDAGRLMGLRRVRAQTASAAAADRTALLQGRLGQAIDLWIQGGGSRAVDALVGQVRVVSNPLVARPWCPDGLAESLALLGYPLPVSPPAARVPESLPRPQGAREAPTQFEPRRVIALQEGWRHPLRRACAPAVSRMQQLRAELVDLLPLCAQGTSLLDRCVAEAFAARVERLACIVSQLHEELLAPIDRNWEGGRRSGHPLPQTAPLEPRCDADHPPRADDFTQLISECDQALAWVEALPGAVAQRLQAWREAAKKAVAAGHAAGAQLRVRRLPASALRRLDNHDLHLLLRVPPTTGADDVRALRQRAYAAVDAALNAGRLPRDWPFDLWEEAQGWDFVEIGELLRPRWLGQG